jgi:hypothetical protein
MTLAGNNILIPPIQLSIGLLEDPRPKLPLVLTLSKDPLAIGIHRQTIIHHNIMFLHPLPKPNHISPLLILPHLLPLLPTSLGQVRIAQDSK